MTRSANSGKFAFQIMSTNRYCSNIAASEILSHKTFMLCRVFTAEVSHNYAYVTNRAYVHIKFDHIFLIQS